MIPGYKDPLRYPRRINGTHSPDEPTSEWTTEWLSAGKAPFQFTINVVNSNYNSKFENITVNGINSSHGNCIYVFSGNN
jgi:hypothetical protein